MKKILTIIICIVLFNTSCTQSSTTPTTPPANTSIYSIDSTYFFKINFNGQTLYDYGVKENTLGIFTAFPGIVIGFFSGINGIVATSSSFTNLYLQHANFKFNMQLNRAGDTVNSPIGAYDLHIGTTGTGIAASAGITDLNSSKNYSMDSASTILNVTSTDVTSATGVVSGKLKDGTTLIPFTGSFCFKKVQ
jgi:hypothetical protein